MAKVMLIMDMPSSCGECVCFHESANDICVKAKREVKIDEKPTWCPLREVPQKMELYGVRDGFARGYNVCIDEILGGESDEKE